MSFITKKGQQFLEDNKRFKFVGVNTYLLFKNEFSEAQLDTHFSYLKADGIKVVRTWAYGTQANSSGNLRYISGSTLNWREAGFVALDRLIYKASQYGIRLILVFTDEFSYGPDKCNYCTWSNTIHATSYTADETNRCWEFMTDSNIKTWFKETISQILNRTNTFSGIQYKNDPTIFSWELGNELEYKGETDTNSNTLSSARIAAMGVWITEMAAYIKSIDTNHMVNIGGQSRWYDNVTGDTIHGGSFSGQSFSTHATDSNIDFFDFHVYPYNDNPTNTLKKYGQALGFADAASKAGFLAQLNQWISVAKAAQKPIVIGEIGIDKRNDANNLMTSYPRHVGFSEIMKYFFNRDGDGFMIWSYHTTIDGPSWEIIPTGDHDGSYNLPVDNVNDTKLRSVISQYSHKTVAKRIPVDKVTGISI